MQLPAPLFRTKKDAHKNDFGHVLVIAGSARMLGAAALTSLAAMRSGAGLVTAAIPESLNKSMQAKISSVVMTWPLPENPRKSFSLTAFKHLANAWGKYQSVVIGPGLSDHLQTQALVRRLIQNCPLPMVIDADALKAIAGYPDVLAATDAVRILTPHLGEMALLAGVPRAWIQNDREKVCRLFIQRNPGAILVLKGHESMVAAQNHPTYVNPTGNSGMATAGSGDVLAGMIAALLAQGVEGFQAAQVGVYLHGLAGDLAAQDKTKAAMIATDIIEKIPEVLKPILKLSSQRKLGPSDL